MARSVRKRPTSTPGFTPSSKRRMNFKIAWSPSSTELLDCSAASGIDGQSSLRQLSNRRKAW